MHGACLDVPSIARRTLCCPMQQAGPPLTCHWSHARMQAGDAEVNEREASTRCN